ncbi:MAG: RidA family protein [Anaerolineae bacterium]|nr:RidA family protein [Anaerolineae bacterium]
MQRHNISSGTVWEDTAGYSRAVRIGNQVWVSGTTATDETGALVGPGDVYAQARYALRKIERALGAAGGSLNDVVRTRIYITDITRWEEAARAHGELFSAIRPANTLVEVSALVGEGYLVEIEADALLREAGDGA